MHILIQIESADFTSSSQILRAYLSIVHKDQEGSIRWRVQSQSPGKSGFGIQPDRHFFWLGQGRRGISVLACFQARENDLCLASSLDH